MRLLLNLVNALVLVYLYYYLSDRVGIDDPGTWVLVLTLVNVAIAAVAAGVGGAWSDRIARRRVFVVVAVIALAAGAIVFAVIPDPVAVIAATVLIGAGWGLYVSVDVAIITQVLPNDRSVGSMLGIANIAALAAAGARAAHRGPAGDRPRWLPGALRRDRRDLAADARRAPAPPRRHRLITAAAGGARGVGGCGAG